MLEGCMLGSGVVHLGVVLFGSGYGVLRVFYNKRNKFAGMT